MRLVQRTCVIQKNHSNKMKQNFKISFIRADSFETIIQNPSHLLQRTENMLSLGCKEDIAICPLHLWHVGARKIDSGLR